MATRVICLGPLAVVTAIAFDAEIYSNCFNCGTNEYFRPCLVIKSWQ